MTLLGWPMAAWPRIRPSARLCIRQADWRCAPIIFRWVLPPLPYAGTRVPAHDIIHIDGLGLGIERPGQAAHSPSPMKLAVRVRTCGTLLAFACPG